MAFKLFNHDRPGPGISKDAPEKRKFVVFFETFFRNFWKFMPINLMYFAVSIPVITNGLATVGITHVTRNTALEKHSFGLSDFFETIKKQDYAMLILKDEIRLLKPKKKYFTLKELQEAVEGYIEVYSSCLPGYLNVVHEEGNLKNLYFNELSYKMFDTEFVGNVLVCPVRIFEKPE